MATPTIPNGRTQLFSTIYEGNGTGRRAGKLVPFEDDATIANSCVFDTASTPCLSKTFGSAGDRTEWTFSAWIRKGLPNESGIIFYASPAADSWNSASSGGLYFSANNKITFYNAGTTIFEANREFNNINKYYHILLAYDSGQSGTDKVKFYIDGVQQTSFATDNRSSAPANSVVNDAQIHMIGGQQTTSTANAFWDGLFSEVNFVDGTALTPSTFGVTDTTTGRWIPKTLTGITYGSNGFRFTFADSSALGDDTSGNTNDFASANLAATDQVLDSPTNLHACLDTNRNGGFTFSEGNRQLYIGSGWKSAGHSMQLNTGKWYWEYKCISLSGNAAGYLFGFAKPAAYGSVLSSYVGGISNTVGIQFGSPNYRYVNGSYSSTGMSSNDFSAGAFVQVAYDADAGKIWFGVNNTWIDDASGNTGNPSTGANALFTDFQAGSDLWANFFHSQSSAHSGIYNWGQTAFNYTPPTGFVAVKQDNFPDLPTGVGIPDLTWIKDRDSTNNHYIVDTSRGLNKYLSSNTTSGNTTEENGVVKMLNGGFELSDATIPNTQNDSYVGWNWVGNSGTTSSNGTGSITSTVQVNSTSKFSIVEWTGTGANGTVGHGLSETPDLIIFRSLTNTSGTGWWVVWTKDLGGATKFMYLNTTNAIDNSTGFMNSTLPTSSVFSVGANYNTNDGGAMVAYCWAGVSGFSKTGTYVGNSNTNGTYIYTGFKPSFVLIKSTSTQYWMIQDSGRWEGNPTDKVLFASSADAESGLDPQNIDLLSNGFKCRGTSATQNSSSHTYMFLAFAEHPFVGDGTNPVTAR